MAMLPEKSGNTSEQKYLSDWLKKFLSKTAWVLTPRVIRDLITTIQAEIQIGRISSKRSQLGLEPTDLTDIDGTQNAVNKYEKTLPDLIDETITKAGKQLMDGNWMDISHPNPNRYDAMYQNLATQITEEITQLNERLNVTTNLDQLYELIITAKHKEAEVKMGLDISKNNVWTSELYFYLESQISLFESKVLVKIARSFANQGNNNLADLSYGEAIEKMCKKIGSASDYSWPDGLIVLLTEVMQEVGQDETAEKLIAARNGEGQFGITIEKVKQVIDKAKSEQPAAITHDEALAEATAYYNNVSQTEPISPEDKQKKIREFTEGLLLFNQIWRQNSVANLNPSDALFVCEQIFDDYLRGTHSGLSRSQIANRMVENFPQLFLYTQFIKGTTWGFKYLNEIAMIQYAKTSRSQKV